MRLTIFTEPQQGASYEDLLRVARHAEACGFDGFFRSDHYLAIGGAGRGESPAAFGLPGPTDAWATLAGLARETQTIRLGTLLTCATFRLPGPLAITVAQVDVMSGGRVELGLGAGWFEAEHRAYGVLFPPTGERFGRLAEQLEIVTGLWTTPVGATYSFRGRYYELVDSPALPKPVQTPRPPVIVGGKGTRRTPGLAARFADEFNVPFCPLEQTGTLFEAAAAACEAAGREPASLRLSAAQTVCCGRTDAEVRRRAEAIGRDVDALKAAGLCGTPTEIVDKMGQLSQIGASRLHLQVLDLTDLDHLDLIAEQVMRQVT
ncbi:MAG: LLM class F420-dependent oxidoreductase [Micromonosporaceae bacterium]|nr:LLM class F420-dependent oxidoreductase [Micromonosporaceae bacterium]